MNVLVRKAIQIHRSLGITVPVPVNSDTVAEAIFQALFEQNQAIQLTLWEENPAISNFNREWERATDRERASRTRFAQRTIKPEQVAQELEESDRILGTSADVERFVRQACHLLCANLVPITLQQIPCWRMPIVPDCLHSILGNTTPILCFHHPNPPNAEFVGRSHPIVSTLAQFLLEKAMVNTEDSPAKRCGLTVTNAVQERTNLFVLRLRYLLNQTLAEECVVVGFTGTLEQPQWLDNHTAEILLKTAQPTGDRPLNVKKYELRQLINQIPQLTSHFEQIAQQHAHRLKSAHDRVRVITRAVPTIVQPQLPLDLLGIYIFLPDLGAK